MDARPQTENPLGLNLDFLYGRGYLWAQGAHVSNWVTLRRLRMEIPDLEFPFDVRGGLKRFRDTRCLVRELELAISAVGLSGLIRSAAEQIDGFEDVEVRLQDGVGLVGMRLNSFGESAFVTFRVAAFRPEPADSDVLELSLFDYRSYGPIPCPVRVLVQGFLRRLLSTDALVAADAASGGFDLNADVLRIRPLKILLLHIFAAYGWKLPNLTNVALGEVRIDHDGATISTRTRSGEDDHRHLEAGQQVAAHAVAAHDAKTLFSSADHALFAGQTEQALRAYQALQDRYAGAAELSIRLLDVLLSDGSPANIAEAESLCRDLEARDPESISAAVARARIALLRGRDTESTLERLADLLAARGDSLDRAYCEAVLASRRVTSSPQLAADRLTEALRAEPRNRSCLLVLRDVYETLGRAADLEDVLKRLTGVAQTSEDLVTTYMALAEHLLRQQGEATEARVFLERALRIAPDRLDILDALGNSWARTGEPIRGIKVLSAASRAAEERNDIEMASRLHHRVARLWAEELADFDQGLLEIQRALAFADGLREVDPAEHAEQLRFAATMCEETQRGSEAIAYWTEALAAMELAEARSHGEIQARIRDRLAGLHREIAAAYRKRGREQVADTHEQHARRLPEATAKDLSESRPLPRDSESSSGQTTGVEVFREKFETATRKPPSLSQITEDADGGALARILGRKTADETLQPAGANSDEPQQPDVPTEVSLEELKLSLEDARKSESASAIAAALERYLEHDRGMTDGRRIEILYELGEQYFYELEDNERALPHLLRLRELDPDGYGARPGVLNAIESIYEEQGSIDGQIEILRTKMNRAESNDMADTYRLLLAQLEWESREDADAARAWLQPVLARDERHEGAHRLLADIAEDLEQFDRAAEHLEIALTVAGDGLDSLELARRLGKLSLHRLDDPGRAAELFEHLLANAPGDQAAMASLRECQAATGDWEGYVGGLLDELGLLLGKLPSDGHGARDWVNELDAEVVPRPLRTTASQILSDVATVMQEQLGERENARDLWGKAIDLWPEHVEALERRIALHRELHDDEALAVDLETYANMLLDPIGRFDALYEAATLFAPNESLVAHARDLLEAAISAVATLDPAPDRLPEARDKLVALSEG